MTASTTRAKSSRLAAAQLTLTGRVQGIGLRPAVARFAQQLSLQGYVANTAGGVEIHVEGPPHDVQRFERELPAHLPAAADLTSTQSKCVEPTGCESFLVGQTSPAPSRDDPPAGSVLAARVPADVVVCNTCLAETQQATDRRHAYPFTSCTDCGPRYSIIDRMPYEREHTSMAEFSLCDRCQSEYGSAFDRRFHAQGNACASCGPQIWLRDEHDRIRGRGTAAVPAAAAALRDGRIVALRGLGGYQLLVDATLPEAVERLRQRKQRRGKPLAVMVPSLAAASQLARLDDTERGLLQSPAGPIVVVAARDDARLAPAVTNGLNTIGLMLPTTPLHWLLLDAVQRPLVCTSANVEGEPLVYEASSSATPLCGVADLWLEHDRPIRRPLDDSVVRVMAGQPVAIRLARGYAPLPLALNCETPLLALGGHQKAALALCNGSQAVLGPHIGDLETVAARQRFVAQLHDLSRLYGSSEGQLVCDQHPEYFTTVWAESHQARGLTQVQHHHAHVVAGMLEHGWLDRQVLGVSFDGTGYGTDCTIWGGEFLRATAAGFERVGHLRPFSLPGGERAVREPWRVATALVREAAGDEAAARLAFHTGEAHSLLPVLRSPRLCPTTTSAGRLFDGVAALILGSERCEFEGQAAMLLEAACDLSQPGAYEFVITAGAPRQLDWRPLVQRILRDRTTGVPPACMATRIHRGLARAIFELCRCYAPLPVVLGGGVFQNRVLVELLAELFHAADQRVGLPGMIPPNDGGLAAGQLAVAATLARQGRTDPCV